MSNSIDRPTDWNSQLSALLRQSYNTLNNFGRTPEQMPDVFRAFNMVLNPYDIETVTKAFGRWIETSPNFPTPADIRKECDEIENSKIQSSGMKAAIRIEKGAEKDAVPWFGKPWTSLPPDIKGLVRRHCAALGIKFEDYFKYLTEFIHYPKDFMSKD